MNNVSPARRGITMVFQSYALYPHLSVARNLGLAMQQAGVATAEITRRVERTLGLLHEDLRVEADRPRPGTVSHAEHSGADTMLYVDVEPLGLLTTRTFGDCSNQVDDHVTLGPWPNRGIGFDWEGPSVG